MLNALVRVRKPRAAAFLKIGRRRAESSRRLKGICVESQFDRLDEVARRVAKEGPDAASVLSTGEKLYVALAANSMELLDRMSYTIPEALARLGVDWTAQLISRWQYRGDPRKSESS